MRIKPRSALADFHSAEQRLKMKSELLLVLALSLCVSTKPLSKKTTYNKLLLISFDGFRWDYDQDVNTPNLDELVKQGVKAKYINPPAITMTSPSHFTTITGKARLSAYLYLIGLYVVRIHTYRQKKNKTEALTRSNA